MSVVIGSGSFSKIALHFLEKYKILACNVMFKLDLKRIDKVVRMKAKRDPIGIENSELINLEFEREFKEKHEHIFKLNDAAAVD